MAITGQTIRPDAIVRPDGSLERGVEIEITDGVIAAIRPWRGTEREESGCILSPAFVNAHSHLEYYDFLGKLDGFDYWEWIRQLTIQKPGRSMEAVQCAANLAARKNASAGVAAIGETSDWPVSGIAMKRAGIKGRIFQEVITVREWDLPTERLKTRIEWAEKQRRDSGLPVHLSPHAPYTVALEVLQDIGKTGEPQSIHVAESEHENEAFLRGTGPIAEMLRESGVAFEPTGTSSLGYLAKLGCLHRHTQIVHACCFTDNDMEIAARTGTSIAHCPRSNANLGCRPARIAEMRRRGIKVGLGLDSAASAGEIDMFAEMRAALEVSQKIGDPLSAEDVWLMATTESAESIWLPQNWKIEIGANPRLMLVTGADSLETAIGNGAAVRLL